MKKITVTPDDGYPAEFFVDESLTLSEARELLRSQHGLIGSFRAETDWYKIEEKERDSYE